MHTWSEYFGDEDKFKARSNAAYNFGVKTVSSFTSNGKSQRVSSIIFITLTYLRYELLFEILES